MDMCLTGDKKFNLNQHDGDVAKLDFIPKSFRMFERSSKVKHLFFVHLG